MGWLLRIDHERCFFKDPGGSLVELLSKKELLVKAQAAATPMVRTRDGRYDLFLSLWLKETMPKAHGSSTALEGAAASTSRYDSIW